MRKGHEMNIKSHVAASNHEDRTRERLPYRRPVVTRFGDVRDITLGSGGSKGDLDGSLTRAL